MKGDLRMLLSLFTESPKPTALVMQTSLLKKDKEEIDAVERRQ